MARLCLAAEPIRIGGDPKLAPKVLPRPDGWAASDQTEAGVGLGAGARRAVSSCAREVISSLREAWLKCSSSV
jgi:hypothetical protein